MNMKEEIRALAERYAEELKRSMKWKESTTTPTRRGTT